MCAAANCGRSIPHPANGFRIGGLRGPGEIIKYCMVAMVVGGECHAWLAEIVGLDSVGAVGNGWTIVLRLCISLRDINLRIAI